MIKKYFLEMLCASTTVLIGMLSGIAMHSSDYSWYATLEKPFFTPPNWVFAPIWTVLYITLGIACAQIIKNKNYSSLILFIAHYSGNLVWSFLFFKLHRIDLACMDIWFMVITLCILLVTLKKQPATMLLLAPYSLWIALATTLNTMIFYNN